MKSACSKPVVATASKISAPITLDPEAAALFLAEVMPPAMRRE
jgi:hypothetical protein